MSKESLYNSTGSPLFSAVFYRFSLYFTSMLSSTFSTLISNWSFLPFHFKFLIIFIFFIVLPIFLLYSYAFHRWLLATPNLPQVPPQYNLSPILLLSAVQISHKLRTGELSSHEVVKTFIDHAKRVNPYVNAIVFDRFEIALEEAKAADLELKKIVRSYRDRVDAAGGEIDDFYADDPRWLLGVPCTVKECMRVKGCPNTSGSTGRAGVVAAEDSPVVARLRAAGAIVLGVTNTSELCMWYESNNYLYGITRNPYDVRRLVGGSSGGEGCAVGSMFAPFGLGSDIGGSIRLPCFFNGIFGHKASTRLVPNAGQFPTAVCTGHFMMTTGPMCRHAEDLLPLLLTMAEGGYLEDREKFPWCPLPPPRLISFRDWDKVGAAVPARRTLDGKGDRIERVVNSTPVSTVPRPQSSKKRSLALSAATNAVLKYCAGTRNGGPLGRNLPFVNSTSSPPFSHLPPSAAFDLTKFSSRILMGVPDKGGRRLRVFVIEDLGLVAIYPSKSQIVAVNECARRMARELHAEVSVINFRNKARCSGAGIPKGWENVHYALNYWVGLLDQEPRFTEVMNSCVKGAAEGFGGSSRDGSDGGDTTACVGVPRKISPITELFKSIVGASEHTFPAIGLMLYEKVCHFFTTKKAIGSFVRDAQRLRADIEAVLGTDGVIICPTYPLPAPRHFSPLWFPFQFQYTALFNALQLPATAVPIWDAMATGAVAPDPLDARRYCVHSDVVSDFHLPRGVQVVSSWGNDILSISIAAELERMFGGYKPPNWAHFATA